MDIKDYIQTSINTKSKIISNDKLIKTIKEISECIIAAYKQNKKILLAGNGGSAADAQHIAAELVSKFFIKRLGLNAFALTTNSSVITSISNDYLLAFEEAKKNSLTTIGLFGDKSVKMCKYCDYIVNIPSDCTPIIQESHIMIGHIICALIEEKMFKGK